MRTLREWMERVLGTIRPRRSDADLEEELRLHLEIAIESERRAGASASDARRAAVVRSGHVAQSLEQMREQRGAPWLEAAGRDLRNAWRAMVRTPGFAITATITLAAGLALCLTVFAVANAYLIRPLPYPSADRLHSLVLTPPGGESPRRLEEINWSAIDDMVEDRIAWDLDMFYLLGGPYPEAMRGAWVTPGFVRGLGLRALKGRVLDTSDFAPGGPTAVMISHRLWIGRFRGDPDVAGRTFRAYVSDRPDEAEAFMVVGVLPPDFWHVNVFTDVIGPLRAPAYPYMLKLRSGVNADVVADRVTQIVRASGEPLPESWRAALAPMQARYVEEMRPLLQAVAVSCVLVLLIACANVAVLLLVRSTRRRHEIAVRMALGAGRGRLAQLLGFEALLLGVAVCGIGLLASTLLARWLAPIVELRLGRRLPGGVSALSVDGTLVAAALAAALLLTVSLTLVPLVSLWSTAVSPALKAGGRASTDGRATRRLRSVLIAGEIAAALALLAGSALMIQSSIRMLRVDPGFHVDGISTASVGLRPRAYPDAISRADYYRRLLRRLEERAGSGSIALSDAWPLQSVHPTRVETGGDRATSAQAGVSGVTSGYFATLGMTFRDGAAFTAQDRPGAEPVVVVSESLARRLWPDTRAIGQHLRIHTPDGDDADTHTSHRVVGVVADVRLVDYDDGQVRADTDRLDAYVPLLREPDRFVFLYARNFPGSPETLRLTIAELDREAAVGAPASLAAAYAEARSGPRQLAWVLSIFAAFAAMLALLGVYSVVAYSVRQREREIGIRLVIGAEPRTVIRGFVREGAPLVAVGLLAGLAGAAGIGQVLRSQLFGVRSVEPSILAATTVLFALWGSLALWWPARRAALVNPTRVLKED